MYSTIFLLLLAAFALLYNLSSRIKTPPNQYRFVGYLKQRCRLSRWISLGLAIIALMGLVVQLGIGAGIFGWIVGLMSAGSLVVILAPFRLIRVPQILLLYVLIVTIELFFV